MLQKVPTNLKNVVYHTSLSEQEVTIKFSEAKNKIAEIEFKDHNYDLIAEFDNNVAKELEFLNKIASNNPMDRVNLCSVYFDLPNKMALATNRVQLYISYFENISSDKKLLIHRNDISNIIKLIKLDKKLTIHFIDDESILVNNKIVVKLVVDAYFPNHKAVIPANLPISFDIDYVDFKDVLDTIDNEYERYCINHCINQKIDYFNNDIGVKVMFSIKNNKVEFIAKKGNDVFYTYNKVFECESNDCIEITFDHKVISNIIKYKSEKIKFMIQNNKSPILCYFDNNKANKYATMPLIY